MNFFNDCLTIFLTLFAVIDILGSLPVIISLKQQYGDIKANSITLASGFIMILFLFTGEQLLKVIGIDVGSFAVAGSIVIFILGLEMILGVNFFKADPAAGSGTVVPIAFPIIAGAGTLTTIISLKAAYSWYQILIGIVANLVIIFLVLHSSTWVERKIGTSGLAIMRKFFGIILLSIAIKLFKNNLF